jgi:hypothetical protein
MPADSQKDVSVNEVSLTTDTIVTTQPTTMSDDEGNEEEELKQSIKKYRLTDIW